MTMNYLYPLDNSQFVSVNVTVLEDELLSIMKDLLWDRIVDKIENQIGTSHFDFMTGPRITVDRLNEQTSLVCKVTGTIEWDNDDDN